MNNNNDTNNTVDNNQQLNTPHFSNFNQNNNIYNNFSNFLEDSELIHYLLQINSVQLIIFTIN